MIEIPSRKQVLEAHNRIEPFVHRTPVLSSRLINEIIGASVFFKCENFQKAGAFKIRGATNAILQLSDVQKEKGVVTHSSGNFAQALALAAQTLGVKSYIVMPTTAPQVKKDGVIGYGGEIIECQPTLEAREDTAKMVGQRHKATFIHPSNDIDVILGQGTACLELLTEQPDLEVIFSPVGGGGLIAGTALSAHHLTSRCKTIGGEPFAVDDAYRSLKSGIIQSNESTETLADGLKTQLGDQNFPIIQKYVERIIRVEESEIVAAMRLIWERLKIVVEPSAAVALAALTKRKREFQNQRIGIIISGGNVDLNHLPFSG
tara:strand:+ start:3065 stop:4018 length:954 start_codon:yes stop_codon:yes gene_type:complete